MRYIKGFSMIGHGRRKVGCGGIEGSQVTWKRGGRGRRKDRRMILLECREQATLLVTHGEEGIEDREREGERGGGGYRGSGEIGGAEAKEGREEKERRKEVRCNLLRSPSSMSVCVCSPTKQLTQLEWVPSPHPTI